MRGTKNLSRQQIQDLLDKNVARLGTGMNMRMLGGFGSQGLGTLTFTIETKRANLPAVLEILRQILREPIAAGQRVRGDEERGNRRRSNRAGPTPCARASTTFSACCPNTPAMTSATCRPLTSKSNVSRTSSLDQVRSLYHDYLGAEHGEVVVVGDFESSEILPILSKTFDGWKSDKALCVDRTALPA